MNHSSFVHLHVHSQFSILDSTCRIKDTVKKAADLKMPALAITDNSVLFGAVDFYEQCHSQGIKPIIGAECYVAPRALDFKKPTGVPNESFVIVLLVKDDEGYQNLMQLITVAHFEGKYYRTRIDKELIKKHSKGLVALSGGINGELASLLIQDEWDKAREVAQFYKNQFDPGCFFIQLENHGIDREILVNEKLVKLAEELSLDIVATNGCHYLERDDNFAHRVARLIYSGRTLNESKQGLSGSEYYFKSQEEMSQVFKEYPKAIENTIKIADMCQFDLDLKSRHLPEFVPPDGKSQEEYLRELCIEGMEGKVDRNSEEVKKRLNHEIKTVAQMGFLSYFLIVWDFIRHAKSKGVPVGPGRGSAAGSLIAYTLGITNVDPLKYGLLFERFLNPDRVSMPDIDIDFCYFRRGEVIDYVGEVYGKKAVAQIITFGTLAARAVIRDVGRVMGISYAKVDSIAKMIPGEPKMTLKKALDLEPDLVTLLDEDKEVEGLFNIALKLEGLPRNTSVHAAGIIISKGDLTSKVALYKGQNEEVITQLDGPNCEKIGLLKMDFLGLKTLTVVYDAFALAKQCFPDFSLDNPEKIPIEDSKTYDLLNKANTLGVFQLESAGMRDLMKRLGVHEFADIVALVALYRPGPMQMADDFIKRKHGQVEVEYFDPCIEPILKETFGIMLYQEQVMQCAQVMAGFTLAEADNLRRIMGKKKAEMMKDQRLKFIDGSVKKGIKQEIAEKTFEAMEYFAGYGFNKSHSVAYGWIAYQTAWLKANYPVAFMTALLTSEMNTTDKITMYVDESRQMGIEVLAPSIQHSIVKFKVENQNIRYGMGAIKGVGVGAAQSIVDERENNGPFISIEDFAKRLSTKTVNKKVLESLICVGAFDELEINRRYLFEIVEDIISFSSSSQRDKNSGQSSFFDVLDSSQGQTLSPKKIQDFPNWAEHDLLKKEKELLGCYISGHPLVQYKSILKRFSSEHTQNLWNVKDGKEVWIGGVISAIRITRTQKNNDKMAIIELEDLKGSIESVVFPRAYEDYQELIQIDQPVFVHGVVRFKNDNPSLIVNEINALDYIQEHRTSGIYIRIFESEGPEKLKKVQDILQKYKGSCQVAFNMYLISGETLVLKAGQDFTFCPTDEAIEEIEKLLGEDSVWLHIKGKKRQTLKPKKQEA